MVIFVQIKPTNMKLLLPAFILTVLGFALTFSSCKSSGTKPVLFCDTACLKDTIRFTGGHPLQPFIAIGPKDCKGDSLIWGHVAMGTRKTGFDYPDAKLNKDFVKAIFNDTSFAYLLFNDCATGRGYQIKVYFNSKDFKTRSSAINSIDPKFSVADGLVAFTDRGNIYVENVKTGKEEMMTFREKIDIDYDAIHEFIDSVNITPTRIWVKVKLKEGWKEIEKNISLD